MEAVREARRAHQRTSLFVLATLTAPSVSGPVKIRNISLCGALIEGAALPIPGEQLSLRRGELSVSGKIVWRLEGKAGVQFDTHVRVASWLPAGTGGQQEVDRTFHELKANPGLAVPPPAAPGRTLPTGHLSALGVADALDALADDLAEDAGVVAAHGSKLQALDIASQVLRKLAASTPS